jgi:hypothetical protein
MLLADFVGRAHKLTEDDRQVPVDLHQVKAFEFGEQYLIHMKNGKTFDVRDLDVMLEVLRDEFHLWRNQWVPEMELGSKFKAARTLTVKAVEASTFVPAPPVQKFVDRLRKYITMYNLSGSWDQFAKENL